MADAVKVTYDGIEIIYIENENKWQFELRGRERSAESLAKAKETIDKPEPKSQKFPRQKAYIREGWERHLIVGEVTSIAETVTFRGKPEYWCMINGKRQKKSASEVFADTPANEALVAEMGRITVEENKLKKELERINTKLEPFAPLESK